MNGFVLWFTGLSGAGKSTLATLVAGELSSRGVRVEVLDGDEVRMYLSKGLGFSREDRDTNVRRIGFVAKLLSRAGTCAITAAISPYRTTREEQRAAIGRFVEIYCKASIDALANRDPKGLYKKALAGEIENFTGVSNPYEEPHAPELVLDTATTSVNACVAKILELLEELGYLDLRDGPRLAPAWGGNVVAAHPPPTAVEKAAEIHVDEATTQLCEAVVFGLLSPLRGPMSEKDVTKLAKEGRIESGLPWPLVFQLASPSTIVESGDVVALVGTAAGVERRYLLEVHGQYGHDGDSAFLAGEILAEPPRGVVAVRRSLAKEGLADAFGILLRRPLTQEDELLTSIGLEVRDKGVAFVCAPDRERAATSESVARFVEQRGLATRLRVVEIPAIPTLDPERDPLLQLVVLRNLGIKSVLVSGERARETLAKLRPSEIVVEIVAAGPAIQTPSGLMTRRMWPG